MTVIIEVYQLPVKQSTVLSDDWRQWPEANRHVCDFAIARALNDNPGTKTASIKSACDRIENQPQLRLVIELEPA